MNDSNFFKSLNRYGLDFKEFADSVLIQGKYVDYKKMVDFVHRNKDKLDGHFTFKVDNIWRRIDFNEDGVFLSIYDKSIVKPINKFFVYFSDYLDERDIYPSPLVIEENHIYKARLLKY
jgi:hypothetical protein